MKNKILRKLCVYAVSASMILPASAPVMAATTTCVYVVQCSHTSSGILHLEQQTQKQLPVHRPGALQ